MGPSTAEQPRPGRDLRRGRGVPACGWTVPTALSVLLGLGCAGIEARRDPGFTVLAEIQHVCFHSKPEDPTALPSTRSWSISEHDAVLLQLGVEFANGLGLEGGLGVSDYVYSGIDYVDGYGARVWRAGITYRADFRRYAGMGLETGFRYEELTETQVTDPFPDNAEDHQYTYSLRQVFCNLRTEWRGLAFYAGLRLSKVRSRLRCDPYPPWSVAGLRSYDHAMQWESGGVLGFRTPPAATGVSGFFEIGNHDALTVRAGAGYRF